MTDLARIDESLRALTFRAPDGTLLPVAEHVAPVADNALALSFRSTVSHVAQSLSERQRGQFWASPGHISCVRGRSVTYLVDWSQVENIRGARACCARLGVPTASWSLGGIGAAILRWLGPPHQLWETTERYLGGLPWGYRLCLPGSYADVVHLDMARAYYQIACRLPSIRLTWLTSGPCWHPMAPDERERWGRLLLELRDVKPLRVCLNGAMLGSSTHPSCWFAGDTLQIPIKRGPFRAAGLCVVRTCYELCWLQAQHGHAVYANTDCVTLPAGTRLDVWEGYGYLYREIARGPADIQAPDVYRIGERQTAYYTTANRLRVSYTEDPAPNALTLRCWH